MFVIGKLYHEDARDRNDQNTNVIVIVIFITIQNCL